MSKIAFFLPVRKGSERVLNKNTRLFAGIEGGLVANKLRQLAEMKNVDEVILSTNDEISKGVAEKYLNGFPKLRIEKRPDRLCSSSTKLIDLIRYVPDITDAEHILWGHVTTPLVTGKMYDEAIAVYKESLLEGYDSLISVTPFRNFLLDADGEMVNNDTNLEWPRTQDLKPLYEINHAMFMAPISLYKMGKRSGSRPKLYEISGLRAHDIDWEEDFVVGEQLFKYLRSKNEEI